MTFSSSGACSTGLYAVLRLHFAQEDERYFSFADDMLSDTSGTSEPVPTQ